MRGPGVQLLASGMMQTVFLFLGSVATLTYSSNVTNCATGAQQRGQVGSQSQLQQP
jgi:hypothetical protein